MINLETRETVVQNLKDAGCSIDMIEYFMKCYDSENLSEQLFLLEKPVSYTHLDVYKRQLLI